VIQPGAMSFAWSSRRGSALKPFVRSGCACGECRARRGGATAAAAPPSVRGRPMSQSAVARALGCSRARVQQIEAAALRKLGAALGSGVGWRAALARLQGEPPCR